MNYGSGRIKRLIAGGVLGLSALAFAPSTASADVATFCAAVPTGQSGFTDIAQAGVHARNVECAKGAELTVGTSPTTYSPTANVSRAQMASFVANMVDKANELDSPSDARTIPDLPANPPDAFTDDETSVHENNINRLAAADIIQGTGGTNYNPSGNVSRAQMASFIAEALEFIRGAALPEGADAFTDDETSVHEANINRLANAGIVVGTGPGTYNPSGEISRAQMASFLVQAMADLFDDGFILAIPGAGNQPVTSQPELVSAAVVSTVASGVFAGTTVAYTFDEPVTDLNAALFHVYESDADSFSGDVAAVSGSNPNVVNVRFNTITTAAGASALTVATVDFDAVEDTSGESNPEGDAPLNASASSTLPAGITIAPNLTSVGNFRAGDAGRTAVDFTFDEVVDEVVNDFGFRLISTDGKTYVGCEFDTGEGTTVLTVLCTNADLGGQVANIAASQIARGEVLDFVVEDAANNLNQMETADVSNSGNTGTPDVVSATFDLNASGPSDTATVVFDQAVTNAISGNFCAYRVDNTFTCGGVATTSAATPNNVLLTFADGLLSGAVGIEAYECAVEAASGANLGFCNLDDEVGVANQTSAQSAGVTSAPDLVSVTRTAGVDQFGTPTGGFNVTYAFDEDVDTVVTTDFYLYLADGTRLVGATCTEGATEATDHTVTCTAYDVQVSGADASNAQVQNSVLGTVDDGAVTEEGGGDFNPEGGAVVTNA